MIRLAKNKDIDRIMEIYAIGRKYMRDNGNANQWINGYPSLNQVKMDIENGNLYVFDNGEKDISDIHGVFAFIIGDDPTYEKIYDGAWHYEGEYGTIHRIGRDGEIHEFVREAVNYCFNKVSRIRIDTHRANETMRKSLEKNGFVYSGIIYVEDGSERLAFEKAMD
ncbi:MAG: N-acetyltransferase [Clostridia bacterium]|nr:N-acetyltransferase [Clostridia bacterium]